MGECVDRCVDRWVGGHMAGKMTNGWMDRWMSELMDQPFPFLALKLSLWKVVAMLAVDSMGMGTSSCLSQSEHSAHPPSFSPCFPLSPAAGCLETRRLPLLLVNPCVLRPGDNGFLDPHLSPGLRSFPAFRATQAAAGWCPGSWKFTLSLCTS